MHRRTYLGVLLVMVVLLTACTGGGNSNLHNTFQITVSVYDAETRELVNDAVYLTLGGEGHTTSSGTFIFRTVSPGKKKLEVVTPGYLTYSEYITISADSEYKVYLTPDDQSLQALVTNIRNAGVSLTNVWEPQMTRLERHIVGEVTPFTEELSDLLTVLMEPLNDPYFEFDVSYENEKIYFSHTYVHRDYYDYPLFRVDYSVDILDYWYWINAGYQSLLNTSFSIYQGPLCIAEGQGNLSAFVTDPDIYEEWARWLQDPYFYPEPSELFFSAADMIADAWFQTPSFGRIETDSKISFDVDTMKIAVSGAFDSEVMYMTGQLSVVLEEIDGLYDWDFMLYPKELEFEGRLGFAGIAEVEGALLASFVPNYYHGTILPDKACLDGSYRDLNSKREESIAQGYFQYNWSKASTFREDYNLGLTAGFTGFIQEPGRPKIELRLEATFDTLLRGSVEIEYAFGSHFLKGSASISNQVNSYGEIVSSSMGIQLRNEHGLRISLTLNENLNEQQPKIGEIKDPDGIVLAELGLSGGIPYIFYPDGHYESLL